jgi:hypothetical protein
MTEDGRWTLPEEEEELEIRAKPENELGDL